MTGGEREDDLGHDEARMLRRGGIWLLPQENSSVMIGLTRLDPLPDNCDGCSSPLAWLGGGRGEVAPQHTSLAFPETNNKDGNIVPGVGGTALEEARSMSPYSPCFPATVKREVLLSHPPS